MSIVAKKKTSKPKSKKKKTSEETLGTDRSIKIRAKICVLNNYYNINSNICLCRG